MASSRRQFITSSTLALIGSASSVRSLFAQQPAPGSQSAEAAPAAQPAPPPPTFTPVRGTVGIFTGQGGTIGYHMSNDGILVVDAQMPPTARTCFDGIMERGGGRKIDYLVNTHHHADHTAGNGVFQPATKKILAHENVPGLQKAAAERAAAQPAQPGMPGLGEQVYANATYKDTWREDVAGEVMFLKYYGPAHTGGDSVVTFEQANVVHMGDLVFNRRHPFIDRPGGASCTNWITVLEETMKSHGNDTIYIFGHANPKFQATGRKAEVAYMRDYVSALLEYVQGAMKAGKSRDEIVKSTDTLTRFPDHGPLIERVLVATYDELAG